MKWVVFRTAEGLDVLLDMDRVEAVYPGDVEGTTKLFTSSGVRLVVKGSFADLALTLEASDLRITA